MLAGTRRARSFLHRRCEGASPKAVGRDDGLIIALLAAGACQQPLWLWGSGCHTYQTQGGHFLIYTRPLCVYSGNISQCILSNILASSIYSFILPAYIILVFRDLKLLRQARASFRIILLSEIGRPHKFSARCSTRSVVLSNSASTEASGQ